MSLAHNSNRKDTHWNTKFMLGNSILENLSINKGICLFLNIENIVNKLQRGLRLLQSNKIV